MQADDYEGFPETFVDFATDAGFDVDWIESEILETVAMMGVYAMGMQDPPARSATFTVHGESELEITVRVVPKRKLH